MLPNPHLHDLRTCLHVKRQHHVRVTCENLTHGLQLVSGFNLQLGIHAGATPVQQPLQAFNKA